MLSDRSHEVISLVSVLSGNTLYRQVVALGGPGGKDDLVGRCTDELSDAAATLLDRLIRRPPELVVTAGSIAKPVCEKGKHLLKHARMHWRGGMVVHVDGQLHSRFGLSSHRDAIEAALLV